MGSRELIESLRKAADERVKAVWREANCEADQARAEVSRKLDQLRENCARMESAGARAALVSALAEANNRTRITRLTVERTISERLFSAAVLSLGRLRDDAYPETFEKLAQELPTLPWQMVRVNPGDLGRAKEHFSGAEIVPDDNIIGGVDVTAEGGSIRVVNTLEKRLERAWDDMLPALMAEVYVALEKSP
jgi:V/A-type H+-transporting ATPase subunit E